MCYVAFGVTILLIYSSTPYYFEKFGATLFNLSLLTAMVYGLIFGMLLFGQQMSWLYIIGYILVIIGIVLYNVPKPSKAREIETPLSTINTQYKN